VKASFFVGLRPIRLAAFACAGALLWLASLLLADLGNAQANGSPSSGTTAASKIGVISRLVPDLASLPETETLRVLYQWQGLAPESPVAVEYSLALKSDVFEGKAVHTQEKAPPNKNVSGVAPGNGNRVIVEKTDVAIPRDVVRAFLHTVLNTSAEEKDYVPRLDHTDDYPSLAFEVPGPNGNAVIGTASQPMSLNGHLSRAPWVIFYADHTYVISTDEIDAALEPLSKYFVKHSRPDSPYVTFPSRHSPKP